MIFIFRYLQYTTSLAADEVEVSTLLLATHLYWPASDRWTSVIVKLWLLLVRDEASREFAVMFNPCPFFVHDTLGDGFPSTTQLKTTFCPSTMVRPSGFLEITGATEKYNKNIKDCYNEQSSTKGLNIYDELAWKKKKEIIHFTMIPRFRTETEKTVFILQKGFYHFF